MACTLNTGRKLPCKSAFGGIKSALFADFGTISAIQVDSTTKQVTTLTNTGNWFKYDVKGNSSLETTVTSSRENGTTFYTQTLNLTLTYLDAKTQAELQEIAVARPYVIVEGGVLFFSCSERSQATRRGTTGVSSPMRKALARDSLGIFS